MAEFARGQGVPVEVATFARVVPGSPFANLPARRPVQTYQAAYAKIADTIGDSGQFDVPEQWQFDWDRRYTVGCSAVTERTSQMRCPACAVVNRR